VGNARVRGGVRYDQAVVDFVIVLIF